MRSVAWLAAVVLLLLAPAAGARMSPEVLDPLLDPIGFVSDTSQEVEETAEEESPVPVPHKEVSTFCMISSETGWICAPDLPFVDPPAPDEPAAQASLPAPETGESPKAAPFLDEPAPAPAAAAEAPPAYAMDDAAPAPADGGGPFPPPAPRPAADLQPVGATRAGPSLDWGAMAAAAFLIPWAVGGLKVLFSLLGAKLAERSARPSLRAAVLETVYRTPGIRHTDLVRAIGRGNGTVEHHVTALLREGRLTRLRHAGATSYFAGAAVDEADARLRLALRAPAARRIAEAVAGSPGVRLTDLARRVGIAPSTAHHHVTRLVAVGALQARPLADGRLLELTPACRSLLP